MYHYITPNVLEDLFAGQPPAGLQPDVIDITEPLALDEGIEVIGISFAGLRFVVFFADVLVYALGDPEWVEETADEWANGFQPAPNARLVKFMRADADADAETMFDPEAWPLPHPRLIWQFCEVLARALSIHARFFPQIPQYFYMTQSSQLDLLSNRLGRRFEAGAYGSRFECVTRPSADTGGFYGFERR
ncbi:hypothetical protein [Cupriavidus pauculus]|uniref:hypothetical protein n=1 Tax=Cupriavidus pauculus TaxID=82633 RepID=UPI001EE17A43|nr:hypothetical protein [Cupriavidus pauculus]GJG96683.1 hypothetical protein CBA19C6_19360 [Cupriavidus pauculus]